MVPDLDRQSFVAACPRCDYPSRQTMVRVRLNPVVICPACLQAFEPTATGALGLVQFDEALADFSRGTSETR